MKTTKQLLSLCILLFTLSCNTNTTKYSIGFLLPNSTTERYNKEKIYFSETIKKLGGTPVVAFANDDDKLQTRQALDMIKDGVRVIVIDAVNQNTAAAIVREAQDKNVIVIAYDRLIQNADLDYFLSFDSEKVGELMAQYAINLKPVGNYMILGGDKSDKNALLVKGGQLKALETSISEGKIKIGYNIYIENWSNETAYQELSSYLDLCETPPDAVLASNDGMASGAVRAIKEHGLMNQIIVTGQDAELTACRSIVNNEQTMTVYKSFKKQATLAASIAMKCAAGEKITEVNTSISNGRKNVPTILIDPIAVDKNNIKSTIIAEDIFKESEIYN